MTIIILIILIIIIVIITIINRSEKEAKDPDGQSSEEENAYRYISLSFSSSLSPSPLLSLSSSSSSSSSSSASSSSSSLHHHLSVAPSTWAVANKEEDAPKPMDLCAAQDTMTNNKTEKEPKSKKEKQQKKKKQKEKQQKEQKEKKKEKKQKEQKQKEQKQKKKTTKTDQDEKLKMDLDKHDRDVHMATGVYRAGKHFVVPPSWASRYCKVHQKTCWTASGDATSVCETLNQGEMTAPPHSFSGSMCTGFSTIRDGGKGLFLNVPQFLQRHNHISLKRGKIPKGTTLHVTEYGTDERVQVYHSRSRSHCRSVVLIRIIAH
jgi:hypothetical protein